MYFAIIVWQKQDGSYYYRKIKGWYKNYPIGFINSYGHTVILVINLDDLVYFRQKSLKTRLISKIIRVLEKIK